MYLHHIFEEGRLQELAKAIRLQNSILLIGLGLVFPTDPDDHLPQKHMRQFLCRMVEWCFGKQLFEVEVLNDFYDLLKNRQLDKVEIKLQEYFKDDETRKNCFNDIFMQNMQQVQSMYQVLAQIPFKAYVTTSYDIFLEKSYNEIYNDPKSDLLKFYRSSVDDALLSYKERHPFILKLHGDITNYNKDPIHKRIARSYLPESIVYPVQLHRLFADAHSLFVGFDKVDPDFQGLNNLASSNHLVKRWLLIPQGHLTEEEAECFSTRDGITTLYYVDQPELQRFLQKLAVEVAKPPKIEAYISYASKDVRMYQALKEQLITLNFSNVDVVWSDESVDAGKDKQSVIEDRLQNADVILLLLSASYLASTHDSTISIEITRAAQRHHEEKARVIPILLRPCHWEGTAFSRLAVLPSGQTPISVSNTHNKDQVYFEVSNAVKKTIEDWIATH